MEAISANSVFIARYFALRVACIDLDQLKAALDVFARNRVVVLELVQNFNGLRPAILRGNCDSVINIGSAVTIHNGARARLFNSQIARQLDDEIQPGREADLSAFSTANSGNFGFKIELPGKRLSDIILCVEIKLDGTICLNYTGTNLLIVIAFIDQLEIFLFRQLNALRKAIGQGFRSKILKAFFRNLESVVQNKLISVLQCNRISLREDI